MSSKWHILKIFLFLNGVSVNVSKVQHEYVEKELQDFTLSLEQGRDCNFFQKYFLWKTNCNSENEEDNNKKHHCTYFQRFVAWDTECTPSENPPYYSKCPDLVTRLTHQDNCEYKPEEFLDVTQIISAYGYVSEAHNVITDDGYILQIHRIINIKKQAQPVFLQHGIFGSSSDFVLNGNISLAFQLANEGYDVWLGNSRGNAYSDGHVRFPNHDFGYWNFSMDEMGANDLDKVMTYITLVTKMTGEIIYIGHSTGTMLGFIYASTRPKAHSLIKLMVAISPTVYTKNLKTPLTVLSPFSTDPEWIKVHLGHTQFRPSLEIRKLLTERCITLGLETIMCDNLVLSIFGFNEYEFNWEMLPVILSKLPSGVSAKTIAHFCQTVKEDGLLQMFDYGPNVNLERYNSRQPPIYNLKDIEIPVFIMYSENNWFSNRTDILRMVQDLPNVTGLIRIARPNFNYLDLISRKDVLPDLTQQILAKIQDFQSYLYKPNYIKHNKKFDSENQPKEMKMSYSDEFGNKTHQEIVKNETDFGNHIKNKNVIKNAVKKINKSILDKDNIEDKNKSKYNTKRTLQKLSNIDDENEKKNINENKYDKQILTYENNNKVQSERNELIQSTRQVIIQNEKLNEVHNNKHKLGQINELAHITKIINKPVANNGNNIFINNDVEYINIRMNNANENQKGDKNKNKTNKKNKPITENRQNKYKNDSQSKNQIEDLLINKRKKRFSSIIRIKRKEEYDYNTSTNTEKENYTENKKFKEENKGKNVLRHLNKAAYIKILNNDMVAKGNAIMINNYNGNKNFMLINENKKLNGNKNKKETEEEKKTNEKENEARHDKNEEDPEQIFYNWLNEENKNPNETTSDDDSDEDPEQILDNLLNSEYKNSRETTYDNNEEDPEQIFDNWLNVENKNLSETTYDNNQEDPEQIFDNWLNEENKNSSETSYDDNEEDPEQIFDNMLDTDNENPNETTNDDDSHENPEQILDNILNPENKNSRETTYDDNEEDPEQIFDNLLNPENKNSNETTYDNNEEDPEQIFDNWLNVENKNLSETTYDNNQEDPEQIFDNWLNEENKNSSETSYDDNEEDPEQIFDNMLDTNNENPNETTNDDDSHENPEQILDNILNPENKNSRETTHDDNEEDPEQIFDNLLNPENKNSNETTYDNNEEDHEQIFDNWLNVENKNLSETTYDNNQEDPEQIFDNWLNEENKNSSETSYDDNEEDPEQIFDNMLDTDNENPNETTNDDDSHENTEQILDNILNPENKNSRETTYDDNEEDPEQIFDNLLNPENKNSNETTYDNNEEDPEQIFDNWLNVENKNLSETTYDNNQEDPEQIFDNWLNEENKNSSETSYDDNEEDPEQIFDNMLDTDNENPNETTNDDDSHENTEQILDNILNPENKNSRETTYDDNEEDPEQIFDNLFDTDNENPNETTNDDESHEDPEQILDNILNPENKNSSETTYDDNEEDPEQIFDNILSPENKNSSETTYDDTEDEGEKQNTTEITETESNSHTEKTEDQNIYEWTQYLNYESVTENSTEPTVLVENDGDYESSVGEETDKNTLQTEEEKQSTNEITETESNSHTEKTEDQNIYEWTQYLNSESVTENNAEPTVLVENERGYESSVREETDRNTLQTEGEKQSTTEMTETESNSHTEKTEDQNIYEWTQYLNSENVTENNAEPTVLVENEGDYESSVREETDRNTLQTEGEKQSTTEMTETESNRHTEKTDDQNIYESTQYLNSESVTENNAEPTVLVENEGDYESSVREETDRNTLQTEGEKQSITEMTETESNSHTEKTEDQNIYEWTENLNPKNVTENNPESTVALDKEIQTDNIEDEDHEKMFDNILAWEHQNYEKRKRNTSQTEGEKQTTSKITETESNTHTEKTEDQNLYEWTQYLNSENVTENNPKPTAALENEIKYDNIDDENLEKMFDNILAWEHQNYEKRKRNTSQTEGEKQTTSKITETESNTHTEKTEDQNLYEWTQYLNSENVTENNPKPTAALENEIKYDNIDDENLEKMFDNILEWEHQNFEKRNRITLQTEGEKQSTTEIESNTYTEKKEDQNLYEWTEKVNSMNVTENNTESTVALKKQSTTEITETESNTHTEKTKDQNLYEWAEYVNSKNVTENNPKPTAALENEIKYDNIDDENLEKMFDNILEWEHQNFEKRNRITLQTEGEKQTTTEITEIERNTYTEKKEDQNLYEWTQYLNSEHDTKKYPEPTFLPDNEIGRGNNSKTEHIETTFNEGEKITLQIEKGEDTATEIIKIDSNSDTNKVKTENVDEVTGEHLNLKNASQINPETTVVSSNKIEKGKYSVTEDIEKSFDVGEQTNTLHPEEEEQRSSTELPETKNPNKHENQTKCTINTIFVNYSDTGYHIENMEEKTEGYGDYNENKYKNEDLNEEDSVTIKETGNKIYYYYLQDKENGNNRMYLSYYDFEEDENDNKNESNNNPHHKNRTGIPKKKKPTKRKQPKTTKLTSPLMVGKRTSKNVARPLKKPTKKLISKRPNINRKLRNYLNEHKSDTKNGNVLDDERAQLRNNVKESERATWKDFQNESNIEFVTRKKNTNENKNSKDRGTNKTQRRSRKHI